MATVDVARIVKTFGGADMISAKLLLGGYGQVSADAVRQWEARGRIPCNRLADLTLLAKAERIKFNFADYVAQDD